ncbi:hypothetical protein PV326_013092, partial [Microctonus aethiopoides]
MLSHELSHERDFLTLTAPSRTLKMIFKRAQSVLEFLSRTFAADTEYNRGFDRHDIGDFISSILVTMPSSKITPSTETLPTGVISISASEPVFASSSAISLPWIPMCPGTQAKMILFFSPSFSKASIVSHTSRDWVVGFRKALMAAWLSDQMCIVLP